MYYRKKIRIISFRSLSSRFSGEVSDLRNRECPDRRPLYTRLDSTVFPAYAFPYVAFARVSLSPLPKANPYPAVPRSPRPPSLALKSIAAIFRLAYYAVAHFAILPECHLHATFPLTCINIYSFFPAAPRVRILRERYIFITFDYFESERKLYTRLFRKKKKKDYIDAI